MSDTIDEETSAKHSRRSGFRGKPVDELTAEELDEAARQAHRREKQALNARAIEAEQQAHLAETLCQTQAAEHDRVDRSFVNRVNEERLVWRRDRFIKRWSIAVNVLLVVAWSIDHFVV